jgi:hypothetical protein
MTQQLVTSVPDGKAVDFTPRAEFRTEILVEPGHAIRRTRGNGSDYGIGSMKMRFLLHGPLATVQFLFSTGLVPEQVPGDYQAKWWHRDPMGFDVGYHADAPQYEGQEDSGHMDCAYRGSGKCFYDGSGLMAEDFVPILLMDGHGGVFRALQDYYDDMDFRG